MELIPKPNISAEPMEPKNWQWETKVGCVSVPTSKFDSFSLIVRNVFDNIYTVLLTAVVVVVDTVIFIFTKQVI